MIDRFEYKFGKWLSGYHQYLTAKQHKEIVMYANQFAAEEFGIKQLEGVRKMVIEVCNDETKVKKLLELLSDEKNGWYITESS